MQDHVEQNPQNGVGGGVSASDEEISDDIKEIVLREAAVLLSSCLLSQHLHQVHVRKIPRVRRVQRLPVLRDNPLQERRDVSFHLPQLLEHPERQAVQQRKDVDEDRGAVHADLQPTDHQAQHGAELVVFVMEALTQDQRADDVWHGAADQGGRVHAGATGLLAQSQQLWFDGGQALQDARLQAQLPQAEVPEGGVAEAALPSPHWPVRCEHYSCSSVKAERSGSVLWVSGLGQCSHSTLTKMKFVWYLLFLSLNNFPKLSKHN